jgi:hypothetical protein
MIDFTFESARYHVQETNATKYRALLDSGKPRKFSKGADASVKRLYPDFKPNMTTADYVTQFVRLNDAIKLATLEHECPNYYQPAPMLDPTFPEVTEEPDPDYVEPIKTRKLTAADRLKLILDVKPDANATAADLWLAIGEIHRIAKG